MSGGVTVPKRAEEVMGAFRSAIVTGDADVVASLYEDDAVYILPALGVAAASPRASVPASDTSFEM